MKQAQIKKPTIGSQNLATAIPYLCEWSQLHNSIDGGAQG